jgi:hypothetical protein
MPDTSTKNTEIALTKELARRLSLKYPTFRIYSNKCPSRSPVIRGKWKHFFRQTCPPLQPEMDLIIWEPKDPRLPDSVEKVRAIEIKCFSKKNGRVNQSFYKGIEQSLALLQWGFDNVALWQFFDETLSMDDIRNYGCKTWHYVHGLLHLPIEFTPFRIIGSEISKIHFSVIQADWNNDLKPIQLLDIDNPMFKVSWTHPNPFLLPYTFPKRQITEINFLRQTLIEWLQK